MNVDLVQVQNMVVSWHVYSKVSGWQVMKQTDGDEFEEGKT